MASSNDLVIDRSSRGKGMVCVVAMALRLIHDRRDPRARIPLRGKKRVEMLPREGDLGREFVRRGERGRERVMWWLLLLLFLRKR